ncbi:MAG: hypothetical protein KF753_19005 [Caldilineaceae bacterium]|nr:hypothetical protein [Caldilineaceae bacterium]
MLQLISKAYAARHSTHTASSYFRPLRLSFGYPQWLRNGVLASVMMLMILSFAISGGQASAQGSTVLRCRLDKSTVDVDANVTLFIEAVDVTNFYGYELTLKYSGTRIHFEDADTTKSGVNLQIGDFLSPDFVVLNEADNSAGRTSLALTQLSPSSAVSGTGELARATLKGVSAGLVTFAFADVVFSDPAGVAIPVTLQNCSVNVLASDATATPTITPTPTTSTVTPTPTGTPPTPTATPTPTQTPTGNGSVGLISGSVFFDVNTDGVRQPNESGVRAFVALYRLASDQQWADITDEDGNYAFPNLPAGRYFIVIRTLDGTSYAYTTNVTPEVQLEVGGSAIVDFGLTTTRFYFIPVLVMGDALVPGQSNEYRLYMPYV